MRTVRAIPLFAGLCAAAATLAGACGTSNDNGGHDGGLKDAAPDQGTFHSDGGCTATTVCPNGGVCAGGACCASSQACGASCCPSSEVCLAGACVTPGGPCHNAIDCPPGQYCETGLGGGAGGDAGTGTVDAGADGGVCTQPLPIGGRCLPLPPVCAADAGSGGADAGCFPACEYHPAPGQLNAVAKWTWGPVATAFPDFTDVWATPTVGRIYDSNCDGVVDDLDTPDIVVVSGRAKDANGVGTCCQCTGAATSACLQGVLRMLDGRTGKEIWSLQKPSSTSSGFAGTSTAIGDIDGDGRVDIVAVTGEGLIVLIDANGNVKRTSNLPIPGHGDATFGWGGGLAIADMDNDGFPEIAYGATVFTTTNNAITLKFTGATGIGGAAVYEALSTFVDLDGAADHNLELLAGNTAYKANGQALWTRADIPDGFSGVGDFNKDGHPDVVNVVGGMLWILDGATGVTELGPFTLPGTGDGGGPTVADFDGDGFPEIGVALANFYAVVKPNYAMNRIDLLWKMANHDLSSSVTGSTVFDFTGQGRASVIYGDECFLWVFDGPTGNVLFSAPHTSFTGTEASLVADVDGDGHAEVIMVSNGADPSNAGWKCLDANGNPTVINGVTWTPSSAVGKAYRGVVAFGDAANSWVGTRTLWSEHTYHVSNICDDTDTACPAPNVYGSIPKIETANWTLPWLNDFRQNVQDKGIFDAPDAVVALTVECVSPVLLHVAVRNIGLSSLPAGVDVGLYLAAADGAPGTQVGKVTTTQTLYAGQTQQLTASVDPAVGTINDTYLAEILIDPLHPKFHECRTDNDSAGPVGAFCTR